MVSTKDNLKVYEMQDLTELNNLIDMAKSIAGSDYKVAKLLNVSPQAVSNWRHGAKPCPAADIALIASIAGLNAEEWLIRATIQKHEGTEKGDRLMKVLGKALLATGATVASAGANATVISGMMAKVSAMVVPGWACVSTWWDILVPVTASTMYKKVKFHHQNA